ncbi:MAG TPA: ATPase, T2SS/T4P/T4SS family [Acidimicrobiales bacterium]|nr:ATPase, T2SS/T4P/T4SS family [Acidimicrobiales bacterium]
MDTRVRDREGALSEDEQLGVVLVKSGIITIDQLGEALARAKERGCNLARVLIEDRLLTEEQFVGTLAEQLGLEFVDLATYPVDPSAARLVSDTLARRYLALPIGWWEGRLIVAMADPSNVFAIDDIRTLTGAEVRQVVATAEAVTAAINKYHRRDSEAEHISAEASASSAPNEDDRLAQVREVREDAPIVRLVNLLISQAISDRASDIHVEPTGKDLRIRYRIDGVLHEVMRSPRNIQNGVISRLKVMADINIAERRIPQDGRITTSIEGHPVDLRVATLPTVHGEKVVMRVLDNTTANLRLSELGFLPANMTRYESSYTKPYGTILVTGPTGSGKTTTLYATLNILNEDTKNVITVEDPVEYQLEGINQVQVNNKAGLTFASALRTILRADPDIILVGEIRDRETASIAVEAALTGHLVLSTLHTNDSSTTPNRLIEMGVEPFLVGSALDCIVAQRLARKLCERCKEGYPAEREKLMSMGWDTVGIEFPERLFRPVGCQVCGKTGFMGRFAVHEILTVNEEIERMIVEHAHADDIRKGAIADGMLTLRQAGLMAAASGITALDEIMRVIA